MATFIDEGDEPLEPDEEEYSSIDDGLEEAPEPTLNSNEDEITWKV